MAEPINVKNLYENFYNNNDAEGAVNWMVNMFTDFTMSDLVPKTDPDYTAKKQAAYEKKEAINSFISMASEAFKDNAGDFDENNELSEETKKRLFFYADIIDCAIRKYFQAIVSAGRKRDEWAKKIEDGKVPFTEMVKDEPKTVKKLAHDIVLVTDLESSCVNNIFLMVGNPLVSSEEGKKYFEDRAEKIRTEVMDEEGISQEKETEYVRQFMDQNSSTSTGFEVNVKSGEGEPLFQKVPEYAERLHELKTEDGFDAYEDELYDFIDKYDRYQEQVRTLVEISKHVLRDFNELKYLADQSTIVFDETNRYFESFTHLGKDYVVDDKDIPVDYRKPTDKINYEMLDFLLKEFKDSADTLNDKAWDKVNGFDKNQKDTDEYKKAKKFAQTTGHIYNINFLADTFNKDFGPGKNYDDVAQRYKYIGYINKKRKELGIKTIDPKLVMEYQDVYTDTLDEQRKKLCTDIINNGVTDESYEKLFKALTVHKRLHARREIADARRYYDLRNKLDEKIEASRENIKKLIKDCKAFEKKNDISLNMTGESIDRKKLLDRISASVTRKTNHYDKDKVIKILLDQETRRDRLWLAHIYTLNNIIKGEGYKFSEEDREKYGFNISGCEDKPEKDLEKAINKYIFKECGSDKPFNDIIAMTEDFSRNRLKAIALCGKDYDEIYKALEGEENRELKAAYLYNECSNTDILAMNKFEAELKQKFMDYIRSSDNFSMVIDTENKELTFGDVVRALGLNETEADFFCNVKNEKRDLNAKLWDVLKVESAENAGDAEVSDIKTKDNIDEFLGNSLFEIFKNRGHEKEKAILSDIEKKHCTQVSDALRIVGKSKKENTFEPINDWIGEKGENIAKELTLVKRAEKMNSINANLKNERYMGVDPATEVGRFYYYSLRQENTYTEDVIKKGLSSKDVIEKIVSEKKSLKLANISPKKKAVNFDTYIDLHTAGRAGETGEEMVENLSKSLAAYVMKRRKESFNVKDIRSFAGRIKKIYNLDSLKDNKELLREALRGEKSVKDFALNIRKTLYAVPQNKENAYLKEMKKLCENMSSKEDRTELYVKLYDAVKEAAAIGNKKLSPEKKTEKILEANAAILDAVEKYTEGKEKIRRSPGGNERFRNALDALAVVSKYAEGARWRSDRVIKRINEVRKEKNPDQLIDTGKFTLNYGAQRAKYAMDVKKMTDAAKKANTK